MSAILSTFLARTPQSAARQDRAASVMPFGDTRTTTYHPPYPLTMASGEGAWLVDVDGNRYLDLLGNYTSLVHGNAYPPIVEAAQRQLARGTAWPARNDAQVELAELLTARVPSVEQVRFCNSGTEATMLCAYVARAVTGRRKVLMARYGYHGSLEEFEVGTLGHGGPETVLATHGDVDDFGRVLDERGGEIACVILEPVMGSGGLAAAAPGALAAIAERARRAGALFVADEVITLRLAVGGAQSLQGVVPDLTAMGKIIGGGFPVGAVGGRADLLAVTDPRAPKLIHSGTFNGNPVSACAGVVSVRELTAERIERMDRLAERLAARLVGAAAACGLPFSVRRQGSLLQCFCSVEEPAANATRSDADLATALHLAALNEGVFFAARGLLALNTVLDEALVDEAADRIGAAMGAVMAEQPVAVD
ncbi:MAG: aspartate aminotransferase family protein [Acidimicrobiia bacterium]